MLPPKPTSYPEFWLIAAVLVASVVNAAFVVYKL